MNKRKRAVAFLLAAIMVISAVQFSAFAAVDEAAGVTIIHINDRHGRTQADPYISRMAKDLEAGGENVLILDAGDSLHGQTPTNLSEGEAMVGVMNKVGYDAMVTGNHDFNFGVERLKELAAVMDFPLLAANVKTSGGENLFEEYKVFEMNGITVGVFGLATPETVAKSDPRIVAGLSFEDPVKTAAAIVKKLKAEGCDVIVALVHMGLDGASAPGVRSDALAAVEGIDVIIDGHSHTLLEKGKAAGGALIAQTGSFAENVGIVEVKISDGKITKTAKTVTIPSSDEEETSLTRDEEIVAAIEAENAKIEAITGKVVGKAPVLLQGEREYVRKTETNLADLITDSMKYATGADIAFLTGGNIRASIEAGDITMGQALTTLPFSNLIATVELKGADVLEALEHGVAKYPELAGEHIQVSGIKFEFDPEAEPMSRVTKAVMADGSELDKNKTYTVATIDFITAGGDGYTVMERAENKKYYQGDVEAFIEYLATEPKITAEHDNRVLAVKGDAAPQPAVQEPAVQEPAVQEQAMQQPAAPEPVAPQPVPSNIYIVKPGDNMTKIASLYGITWRELYKLNGGISDPNLIYPGQELRVPEALPEAS